MINFVEITGEKEHGTVQNLFLADSFKKNKIKTNPKNCILMYFKIQSDPPIIIQKVFKKSNL